MFGTLAEFERSLIRERPLTGLAAAHRAAAHWAGRTGGRRRNSRTTTSRPPRRACRYSAGRRANIGRSVERGRDGASLIEAFQSGVSDARVFQEFRRGQG
jgi:DNA invertase Pin-like site-specific DNA recombinase